MHFCGFKIVKLVKMLKPQKTSCTVYAALVLSLNLRLDLWPTCSSVFGCVTGFKATKYTRLLATLLLTALMCNFYCEIKAIFTI